MLRVLKTSIPISMKVQDHPILIYSFCGRGVNIHDICTDRVGEGLDNLADYLLPSISHSGSKWSHSMVKPFSGFSSKRAVSKGSQWKVMLDSNTRRGSEYAISSVKDSIALAAKEIR